MANQMHNLSAKIALLGLLSKSPNVAPIGPTEGSILSQAPSLQRTLALRHELFIAQQFAFLCSYSPDPLHVLAACIEEKSTRDGVVIRLTANHGGHRLLVNDLKKLAAILQNEAKDIERTSNRAVGLRLVVASSRKRILHRLRSRHASQLRKKDKPSLIRTLDTAVALLKPPRFNTAALRQELEILRTQFRGIEALTTKQVESEKAIDLLVCLIETVNTIYTEHRHLLSRTHFTPARGTWNQDATASLIDRLGKISHYHTICDDLLRLARRYSILSNISVRFEFLQHEEISVRGDQEYTEKIVRQACSQYVINQTSDRLKILALNAKHSIQRQLSQTSRLHAEIQLLLYYERRKELLSPRVICASKSACYLCHLFFRLHGRHCIPDSHGRLYERWRWPCESRKPHPSGMKLVPAFPELLGTFSQAIDETILRTLGSPIAKRCDPRESRVDIHVAPTPSTITALSSQDEVPPTVAVGRSSRLPLPSQQTFDTPQAELFLNTNVNEAIRSNIEPDVLTCARSHPIAPSLLPSSSSTSLDSDRTLRNPNPPPSPPPPPPSSSSSSSSSIHMSPPASSLHTLSSSNDKFLVHTPDIRLDLQYCLSDILTFATNTSPPEPFELRIECLTSSRLIDLQDEGRCYVVELEADDDGGGDDGVDWWTEKTLPEGVLFASGAGGAGAGGLILMRRRQGSTALLLRSADNRG